jgi:SAM-dependent methyltransferase
VNAQIEQGHPARGGFWQKLNTWWGGDENGGPGGPSAGSAYMSAQSEGLSQADRDWPQERIRVLNGLFGDGLIAPWSDQIQDHLIRELKVKDDSRVVVMGGGLGGPAHRLQAATGASVFAFDDRIEIADLARDWLSAAGSKVKQDRRDYFETGLKPDFADAIVAFGGFSHLSDRKRLFNHLLQMLRPNGRIVYMDFFITGRDPHCPEVAIWSALEDRPRHLTSQNGLSSVVYEIGFDQPSFRDVTSEYRSGIKTAFARSVDVLKEAGPEAVKIQPALITELERWNRRLALLDSGEARFYEVTIEYFGKSAVV